jgi:hypothetical protein
MSRIPIGPLLKSPAVPRLCLTLPAFGLYRLVGLLPADAVQKVCVENARRLFGMDR